jgi:hypothetical protein
MAGTTFKITLEVLRLFERFERDIDFQFLGHELHGMRAFAGIVIGDALFQVGGVSDVVLVRMVEAFNDVGIKHGVTCFKMACHP